MSELSDPLRLGPATARNRIFFGPHETNLGRDRALSDRHVAYYAARAAGGVGVVVLEEASVHCSDWPYERAPLAEAAEEGWEAVGRACHLEGALALAALGHCGGQGSSAYQQRALWGPSGVADVVTREVAKTMEPDDLRVLVAGFAAAAEGAARAGLDGVEINAGQWSLLRQFLSRLTNKRKDAYGEDRSLLVREVLSAVRAAEPHLVLGVRFSCDELAPWAGIVPEEAADTLASLGGDGLFDYVTVVRGSAYWTSATRPDGHVPEGFNASAAAVIRAALPRGLAVVLQGSIVDPGLARSVIASGTADAVEATRAQIADPSFSGKALSGEEASIRPCVLCNQLCQVRDVRNPLVSCIGEPASGHELDEPAPARRLPGRWRHHLLVVGGGPGGLECARVAKGGGLRVRLLEREAALGGMVPIAGRIPGRSRLVCLTDHLERECEREGVEVEAGEEATLEVLDAHDGPIVIATGSRPGLRFYAVTPPAAVLQAADVLTASMLPGDPEPSSSVVWDPIGGPVGVGVAEFLALRGAPVVLVTPDVVAGSGLARSGDLAPSNGRLARLGVGIRRHASVVEVTPEGVVVEDRFSGERELLGGAVLVDAGPRLGEDYLSRALAATGRTAIVVGDALAPRSIHEAVLEGRRAALALLEEVA